MRRVLNWLVFKLKNGASIQQAPYGRSSVKQSKLVRGLKLQEKIRTEMATHSVLPLPLLDNRYSVSVEAQTQNDN